MESQPDVGSEPNSNSECDGNPGTISVLLTGQLQQSEWSGCLASVMLRECVSKEATLDSDRALTLSSS